MAIVLFEDQRQCCGCGACQNACPRDAITMKADERGFVYPQINSDLCVECKACLKVCGYQTNPPKAEPRACYAAAAKDAEILQNSSSGGIFSVLAAKILNHGGVVYGAALQWVQDKAATKHMRIETLGDLSAFQGSKYVQSEIGAAYQQCKRDLQIGKEVLFSGTPCQIAGLLAYLGQPFERLLTVEVICHGVPNAQMFQDFLNVLEAREKKKIADFRFRHKKKGQGTDVRITYRLPDGNVRYVVNNGHLFSYMHYFLNASIYRSNCYSCPFATKERVADITLGDFWGFHEEYPLVPSESGLDNSRGVSCVLVNSSKGQTAFEKCRVQMFVLDTQFERIACHNEQLNKPSHYNQEYETILGLYQEKGYLAVENYYRKQYFWKRFRLVILSIVPKSGKRTLQRIIGLVRKAAK
ncbi:MAG: Coenzyme F420 hydrogenase/dehydrogenase, beta subunit C-terminal domain [Clostridia bacterium]|nr:Coenzyme F420 hydrogenase/dehydrogenase, beta subunit C-terminal domain [Clostridia bacterium]